MPKQIGGQSYPVTMLGLSVSGGIVDTHKLAPELLLLKENINIFSL